MSSVGKTLVVINLVLSVAVLASLGSLLNARKVTQDDNDALRSQLAAKEGELSQALSDKETALRAAGTDKTELEFAKQDLEVANDNLERNNAKLAQDNQQLRDDFTRLSASLELLQGDLSNAMQRNTTLQDDSAAQRQAAFDAQEAQRQAELARRDLEDQITSYEDQIAGLQSDLTDALARGKDSQMLLDVAVASGFDPTAVMAMPAIDAIVAQVDNELGFVILDKGADSEVQRGFTFDVYRGGNFLGRVRVDQVHDRYSTASIVLADAEIQRFDQATTRL